MNYCKKYKAGNCCEYAYAALHLLMEKNDKIPAKIIYIKNGDHVFLVLGLDPNCNPENYETWGPMDNL